MDMRLTGHLPPRDEAQDIMCDAMDAISQADAERAVRLCHKALEVYSDCVDALTMLAEIETRFNRHLIVRLRAAVEAGRRDLGPTCFDEDRGHFWGLIETRPFMRAMAQLAIALTDSDTPRALDEAIEILEEMLDLNPGDNQGMRDWLAGCYLARKRYDNAAELFASYSDDGLAGHVWGRVLLAYVTEGEESATPLLAEARNDNPHIERYLTGEKRLPRHRADFYSPGDENEAIYCAEIMMPAWRRHPKAKTWLKRACSEPAPMVETKPSLTRSDTRDLDQLTVEVPDGLTDRFAQVTGLMDRFCETHLNDDYRELCRHMAICLCHTDVPLARSKPESWAAGIVCALGRVNFLTDPAQSPHMKSQQIADGFGISVATMQSKAKIIDEALELVPFHPEWTVPGMMDENPLVWMLGVDGIIIDIRRAPREMQEAAFEKGLIPYVPADCAGMADPS